MALLWSDFRTQIYRSILKDPNERTWSRDQMLDFCGWALDQFCSHTAVATATSFSTDGTDYIMPDNVYDNLEKTAVVALESGDSIDYLSPVKYLDSDFAGTGYYVLGNTIKLTSDPGTGQTLRVEYFAHYNKPVADSNTIDIPSWARQAVAHLIGGFACSPQAMQEVTIAQFKEKPESGSPDDSAMRSQQRWMFQVYETLLAAHQRQDRENFWRRE